MAMPSSTAIVWNSFETPPAVLIDSATMSPKVLQMNMTGHELGVAVRDGDNRFPESSSVMPVAPPQGTGARMVLPWVEVRDRSAGIRPVCHFSHNETGSPRE